MKVQGFTPAYTGLINNRIGINYQTAITSPVASHIKAQSPGIQPAAYYPPSNLRFGFKLLNDKHIEVRPFYAFDEFGINSLLREMLVRDLYKKSIGDTSTLKLVLDTGKTYGWPFLNQFAFADSLRLLEHKTDVIIRSENDMDGLPAFLLTTGKRFMTAGANLTLGKVTVLEPDQNSEEKTRLNNLYKDYVISLKQLISEVSGEKDMKMIGNDLNGLTRLNTMQALMYGEKGLIDAALIGEDKVLTRADMDAYFKQQKFDSEQIREFIQYKDNIRKIPPQLTIEQFSPESMGFPQNQLYKSAQQRFRLNQDNKHDKAPEDTGLTFYYDDKTGHDDSIFRVAKPVNLLDTDHIGDYHNLSVENPPANLSGILQGDTIFFNSVFISPSVGEMIDYLKVVDEKKEGDRVNNAAAPKNTLVVINSVGGDIATLRKVRDQIQALKHPVDMLTMGMALSCGSLLLSSATGNRFALPNARVLIHVASQGGSGETGADEHEKGGEALNQSTLDCAEILSIASGKDRESIMDDMDIGRDVWFSPLEAMFYGPKGLVDMILTGPQKGLTRDTVWQYLLEGFNGDAQQAQEYVDRKIAERLRPNLGRRNKSAKTAGNDFDPFSNPLQTIQQLAATKAQSFDQIPPKQVEDRLIDFKASLPTASNTIEYFHVQADITDLLPE